MKWKKRKGEKQDAVVEQVAPENKENTDEQPTSVISSDALEPIKENTAPIATVEDEVEPEDPKQGEMKKIPKKKKRRVVWSLLLTFFLLTVILALAYGILNMYNAYLLTQVQEECEHSYEGGVCINCGLKCDHELWRNGVCTICGMQCQHNWQSGRCIICGYLCEHKQYNNGICVQCGYQCRHIKFRDGVCVSCGYKCPHEWKNGICKLCKCKCQHMDHDKDSQVCFTCGRKVVHKYVDGICSCKKTPTFANDWIDKEFFSQCEHMGTIETVSYEAPNYDGTFDGTIVKDMDIYLPYNYDPTSKYDVLIMYHGGFDDCHSWTTNWYAIQYVNIQMRNLYDNMIDKKLCSPLIIVCPSTGVWDGEKNVDVSIAQNTGELTNIILPYLAEHYATYAENSSSAALKAAREHFGVGGCSNGSLFAYNCGFLANFEYFGNYACMSGDNCSQEIADSISKGIRKSLPIACYYAGAGETDSQRSRTQKGFELIVESSPQLEVGKNAYFQMIKSSHDWKTFSLSLYNALQVLFPYSPIS